EIAESSRARADGDGSGTSRKNAEPARSKTRAGNARRINETAHHDLSRKFPGAHHFALVLALPGPPFAFLSRVFDQAAFEQLLPLAYEWAKAREESVLAHGAPLSPRLIDDARLAGVRDCNRVRVLVV